MEIQRRTNTGRWQKVASTRSGKKGTFTARFNARRGLVLRSFAPATRGARATRSTPHTLDVVRQRGTLSAIPPIADPGLVPTVPAAAAQVLATFTPALPGEAVILQSNTPSGWVTVATGEQNLSGTVAFPATPGTVYRAATSPRAVTAPLTARSFDVLFADDFSTTGLDGRSPNPAVWGDQVRPDPPDRPCSVNDPAARTVTGGVLHLQAVLDPDRLDETCTYNHKGQDATAPYLLNAQVATTKTFSFTYGYAAARIKMHASPGAHAGFWLLPKKTAPDQMPPWHDTAFYVPGDPSKGHELDIVEYWANSHRRSKEPAIGSFVHWVDETNTYVSSGQLHPEASRLRPPDRTWDNAFHVFAVQWTPTEYEFMVDGQVYAREDRVVSRVPQFLTLSMLSADYEADRITPGLFETSAQVDWVRVWSL